MKNKLFLPVIAVMILLLTACSSSKSVEKKTNINKEKTESVFYDSLNSKAKKDLKFKFSESQDETKDNTADPVYVVSMKVTNNTKKNIKFDKSKFLIFVSEQTKFQSAKSGILTLKPGKSAEVHQLFENVAEQALVGGGSQFIYLNKDNKLADANFTIKDESQTATDNTEQSSSNQTVSTNSNDSKNGSPTYKDDDGNHVATGDYYDDNNPTAGWDESNLDPQHDGKRLDRILAWTEHYKQIGLDQGMSDEDAQSYGQNIAYEKENAYEENN